VVEAVVSLLVVVEAVQLVVVSLQGLRRQSDGDAYAFDDALLLLLLLLLLLMLKMRQSDDGGDVSELAPHPQAGPERMKACPFEQTHRAQSLRSLVSHQP
jgi:hypothetical protein